MFFLRNFGLTGLSSDFLGQFFARWSHQKIKMRIFCHLFPALVEFFALLKEKNPRSSKFATQ